MTPKPSVLKKRYVAARKRRSNIFMPKKKSIKEVVCDYDNLYDAMIHCSHGVMWKDSVAGFVQNGPMSVYELKRSLDKETYRISPYNVFYIYEPKKRKISAVRMKDRVFNRAYCKAFYVPLMAKSFTAENGACQKGKGTDYIRKRLRRDLISYRNKYGKEGYAFKLDIKDFFGSTRHDVLKSLNYKKIKDMWAYERICQIIDRNVNDENPGVGVGLGAEPHQIMQLALLSPLDHYIKESLHIEFYERYSDDLVIIGPSKEYLREAYDKIFAFLDCISLKLHPTKCQLVKLTNGFSMLGFRYYISSSGKVIVRLVHKNISKRRRKIRIYHQLYLDGKVTYARAKESYNSWRAHAAAGNCHELVTQMDAYFKEVWKDELKCLKSSTQKLKLCA